jgi:hypothetical protein
MVRWDRTFHVCTNMPAMLRPRGKASRIAYKILGVPINFRSRPAFSRQAQKRLQFAYTIQTNNGAN